MSEHIPRIVNPKWVLAAATVAVVFGGMTVFSGGTALFGDLETRAAFGDIVPYVLWFNFLAGFAYILAGIGLFRSKRWAAQLAVLIAVASGLVLAALGVHVATGGAFEMRTVGAMVLRTGVWIVIAVLACRALGCRGSRPIGT